MSKVLEKIAGFLPRKIKIAVATMVVEAARSFVAAKFPDLTLPSTDQIIQFGLMLIGAHTVTDVFAIIKDGIVAYSQTKKLPKGLD